ncbi:hypothetical protein ACSBR2_030613 [Camellia fascicularis]
MDPYHISIQFVPCSASAASSDALPLLTSSPGKDGERKKRKKNQTFEREKETDFFLLVLEAPVVNGDLLSWVARGVVMRVYGPDFVGALILSCAYTWSF